MWLKTIFLIISLKSVLIASQTISCNYRQVSPEYPYTCELTLNNPNGLDNFDRIQGEHMPNRSDADVINVFGYNQNSRIIPTVICRQFPNLLSLQLSSFNIETITEAAFAECRNLETVMFSFNNIREIPANTFRNNQELNFVYLSYNEIQSLNPNSFAGTQVQYLSLGMNLLTEFNPEWLAPISTTLETLEILANDITTLPSRAFSSFPNLLYLDLTGNKFTSVPGDVFSGLSQIENIFFSDCDLPQINPEWFTDLVSLDEFHYEFNGVSELPDAVFAPLIRLRRLYLSNNNISSIGTEPFGSSVAQLEVLSLAFNPISSVDRELMVQARFLNTLGLYGGNCLDTNLYNLQTNQREALELLEKCFANFGPEMISCEYEPNADNDYSCTMSIRNPLGVDFPSIDGEHLADRGDGDVLAVAVFFQSTQTVPQVICRQFTQLRDMIVMSSFVENLNLQSFDSCRTLERLDLSYNEITTVDDNTFVNNPLLRELHLGQNRIARLNPNSFAGSGIQILDLSYNRLFEFNPAWSQPIENTLVSLDLLNNNMIRVEADTFSNLRGLTTLVLSRNFFSEINGASFSNLGNLEWLSLSSCNIRELNPDWFAGLSNLQHLSVANNQLRDFPPNIFNSLTSLEDLHFYNNRIVDLRADSFGASLGTIRTLYGSNNLINVFDLEILDRTPQLSSLLFNGNLCTQLNIFDANHNDDFVRESLQTCAANFALETTLSCRYDRMITGRIYWCSLTMTNPLGRDDFERVEGNHLPGANDDSVVYIESNRQNSRVFPSAVCRQFQSLQILDLIQDNIDEITEETFRHCGFLRELMLMGSRITRLPERAFQGASNLITLFLDANGIEFIAPTAFAGTQIQLLDLSFNEIHEYIPATYEAIGSTLQILRLTENRLEELPANAFDNLPNLVELELNHNHFFTLPATIFHAPVSLRVLQIANCGIERIQPGLFSRLENLVDLELALNDINLLPDNIFDLPRLHTLGLDGNNLHVLDANAFGRSLGSLYNVDASLNRIAAFDPEVISNTSNIRNLNMAYNSCPADSYRDIPNNRGEVLNRLSQCISTFNNVPISCTFTEDEAIYECALTLNNVNDRLRFESIAVEHLPGHNDNFVSHVYALDQNSRTIPSIICQQFSNVEAIFFIASNVEVVSSEAFANCENLYSINLSGNRILEIVDGTFSQNQYLAGLTLASNQISRLTPGIFQGTQIYYLDIENNQFRDFNPQWLEPVASNLRYLILRNNAIRRFPDSAFASFRRLNQLDITGNRDTFVPSDSFLGLRSLFSLEMANCGLMTLNTHWFRDLHFLSRLEVDMNGIGELPQGIFNLPYLTTLGIAFNHIRVLDSRAFGSSLEAISTIDAEENQIDAIDRRIITNSTGLNDILLAGNVCSGQNFIDIQNQMTEVMEALLGCFDNFDILEWAP